MTLSYLKAPETFLEFCHAKLISDKQELRMPFTDCSEERRRPCMAVHEAAVCPNKELESKLRIWMQSQDAAMEANAERALKFRRDQGRFPLGGEVVDDQYLMPCSEFESLAVEIRNRLHLATWVPISSGARYGAMRLAENVDLGGASSLKVALRWDHESELLIHRSLLHTLDWLLATSKLVPVFYGNNRLTDWVEVVPQWVRRIEDLPAETTGLFKCPDIDWLIVSGNLEEDSRQEQLLPLEFKRVLDEV